MILGFDSSFTLPDDAGLRQAKADGVGLWAGYMITKPSGIASWPKSNFDRIKAAGLGTWAYVSGNDDPAALKAQAAAWGVRIILDVENGIRGDGAWVQGFLDTSGAGLYGGISVFAGRRAACYVEASYPGGASPKATWPNASPPNGPHGWQSQGSHPAYGATVDSGYYDDWFLSPHRPAPQGGDMISYQPNGPQVDMVIRGLDAHVYHLYSGDGDIAHAGAAADTGFVTVDVPWCAWTPDGAYFDIFCVGLDTRLWRQRYGVAQRGIVSVEPITTASAMGDPTPTGAKGDTGATGPQGAPGIVPKTATAIVTFP